MANDDLDLTFIRCPSCRSLVPATATRCRMCGYLLQGDDAGEADSSPEDSAVGQKGRVRQRTISLSEDERDEIKDKIAEADAQEVDEPEPEDEGFAEEVHEEPAAPVEEEYPEREQAEAPPQETAPQEDEDFADDGSDVGFEEADPEFEAEMRARREELEAELARRTSEPAPEDEPAQVDDDEQDDLGDSAEAAGEEDEESADAPAEPKRRRRRRRKKKRPARDEAEEAAVEAVEEADAAVQQPQPAEAAEQPHEDIVEEDIVEEITEEAPVSAAQESQSMQVSKGKQDGALVAWFVHYQDNTDGVATEIREGRFFVGGSRLKDTDIVIPHDSISTPHCLIKAEPGQGVFVQDLMSVEGTLVKKKGSSEWEPVPVPAQLNHGDWLKLGSYEVMVCVIPQA